MGNDDDFFEEKKEKSEITRVQLFLIVLFACFISNFATLFIIHLLDK